MTDEIRFSVDGGLATVDLARPAALNALTLDMIRALRPKLEAWEEADGVGAVVVRGDGDRAFCAGGDVLALYRSVVDNPDGRGPSAFTRTFFFEEYQLNHIIHAYSKPYLAILDGVTMGGGVGLSVHGSHRIATERLMFAMPETGVGLFPDVGGGWFLPRLPGEVGMYLGLTGARIGPATALALGIATHYVPSTRLEGLHAALATTVADGGDARVAVNDVLDRLGEDPGPDETVAPVREVIDRCFGESSVEAVIDALEREAGSGSAFARKTVDGLGRMSPTSLKMSFEQIRRGRAISSLEQELAMEYRLSQACMAGHDFFEGIRALLVDRDKRPVWSPARLGEVDDAMIGACFEFPVDREFEAP